MALAIGASTLLGAALSTPAAAADWTGATSSAWFVTGNWNTGIVPTSSTNVILNTTAPNPTLVDGASAVAQTLFIGRDSGGVGSLTILNGGAVNNGQGLVGRFSGSVGIATVDGAGSTWTNSDALYVGFGGTGTLTISNGGAVSNTVGTISDYDENASGAVTVDGAGSTWTNTGKLLVGNNSIGTLTITNGGDVASAIGFVGNGPAGTGTVTVDGVGSTWTNSGDLTVGNMGTGRLTISNGGAVSSVNGVLGNAAGSTGTVTVDGVGSTWASSNVLYVGNYGTGTLNVLAGGTVSNTSGSIATNVGSNGTVTVTGAGSTWTNSFNLGVGDFGTGTLNILNGGAVSNVGGVLGGFASGTGTATVDGVGSTWTNSGDLTVGHFGKGTLTITSGGTVSSVNGVLGSAAGSTGMVTVDGAGSTWASSNVLYVGNYGIGTLNVLAGGAVSNTSGSIATNVGSNGTVMVTGAGSTWTNSFNLGVGDFGTGTLNILNGGAVSNVGGVLGGFASGTGTATVDGVGSTWTNSGSLTVGNNGIGALNVLNGGAVNNGLGYVGNAAGSVGTVTVDGIGSTWTNSSKLFVGYNGIGTLNIINGGVVSNTFATLGTIAGSEGSVVVNGAGSTWANSGDLSIGWNGVGALTISKGGKVTSGFGDLAVNSGSTGSANVSGTGSTWTNIGNLIVGHGGTGSLSVMAGGAASNVDGILGYDAGSAGTVRVDGTDSTWTNSGSLIIGNNGTGALTIANRGVVSVGGVALIASQAGSTGTLNIGGAVGSAPAAAGTLNTANVLFGLGTGAINFNHTNANYTFAPAISSLGTINQLAGDTNLTADSSGFIGATNVLGGRLSVNGSLANSLVTVSGGGILGGNGIVGGIVANAGGIIGPGNSIGTLNVNGNVSQAAGSTYQVELTSTGLSDLINATGTATIANGATLNVIKMDAAPYVLGTHYTVLQADGGVSGTYTLTGNTAFSAFIGLVDHYDPTHVYLDVAQTKTFTAVGLTRNQIATAGGAEGLGSGNPLYDAIMMLPTDAVARRAFDQLSGEVHASVKGVMIDDSRFVRETALDRLRAAFDSVGAVTTPVMTYVDGKPVLVPATSDRFAVWGRGFGSWGQWNGDGNAATIKRDIGGFFVGADGLVTDSWRVGMIGGYSRSSFNVRDRNSSGSSDNYHVGLYGGTQWGDLAFRSGLAYTWHDISTSRSVALPGFADSLKADYNAGTAQVFGEFGCRIDAGQAPVGALAFEPFANLAYVNLSTDRFSEKGGAAALTSRGDNADVTFTTLGLRASTQFTMDNAMNMAARGMLGWRHAFGDTTPLSTLAFAGGSPFNIAGAPIAQDAAVIEAGLDFAITPSATLGLTYGGQFGSGATDQTVRGSFAVKF